MDSDNLTVNIADVLSLE